MPTIRHVWQLFQHGDYAFSIDLQDASLHIPIVKHHHHFLWFIFGLAAAPWVFTALTKPILFLYHCKDFHIVIYLNDILVLVHSMQADKRAHLFLCSLLVRLGLHINFCKSDLCLLQTFCFLELCWDTVCMSLSLSPDKLADIQQLALSLLQSQCVAVHKVMFFLGKANFCTSGHSQLWHLCCVIQSDMLMFTILPIIYFLTLIFPFPCNIIETFISFATEPSSFAISSSWCGFTTDAMPTHWAFYFQRCGLSLSVSGSWSGSMCRAHIALQEL